MHLHRYVRNTLLMVGVTLIVLPAAISDGHQRHGHDARGDRHGPGVERNGQANYVFKGTFAVADSSVTVLKGNKRVRRAGFVGKTVVFDLSAARIRVADVNGDGKHDAADLKDGDKVVVQARLARRDPGAGPFAARKLVDRSSRHHEAGDHHAGDDQPAGDDKPAGDDHHEAGDDDGAGDEDHNGEDESAPDHD